MTREPPSGEAFLAVLDDMIEAQRRKVLATGRRWVCCATDEDLRNAEDFEILRCQPLFHFEDGLLAGLLSARTALRAGSSTEIGP